MINSVRRYRCACGACCTRRAGRRDARVNGAPCKACALRTGAGICILVIRRTGIDRADAAPVYTMRRGPDRIGPRSTGNLGAQGGTAA